MQPEPISVADPADDFDEFVDDIDAAPSGSPGQAQPLHVAMRKGLSNCGADTTSAPPSLAAEMNPIVNPAAVSLPASARGSTSGPGDSTDPTDPTDPRRAPEAAAARVSRSPSAHEVSSAPTMGAADADDNDNAYDANDEAAFFAGSVRGTHGLCVILSKVSVGFFALKGGRMCAACKIPCVCVCVCVRVV
jgi:hypothetical protein